MWSVVFYLGLIQAAFYVTDAIRIEKTGGAAGAVVAARLSEVPEWKVLLLEAGPDEPAGAAIPANYGVFLGTEIDWRYKTTNESNACLINNGSCRWPRGKNLGGSTVHHAMMYHRGNARDYDNWAEMGNDGWSSIDVLPFFKKSEDNTEIGRVSATYHGTGGEMTIERFPWQPPFVQAVLEAADETGYGITEDMNGSEILGFTVAQSFSKNGVRQSSSTAFLRPIRDRKNLHVALNATATKIVVRDKIVCEVEYVIDGKTHISKVKREVVISGGIVNSPQLLLLSGIGPADDLRKVGIPVVHDLPGVGKNLHNHISYPIDFTVDDPRLMSYNYDDVDQYLASQTGPLSSNGMAQVTANLASKYTTPDWPDMQIFIAGYQESCKFGSAVDINQNGTDTPIRLTAVNLHTKSRGVVSLASKNPLEYPIIWSNDLGDPYDTEVLIEAIHVLQNIANTSAMKARGLKLATQPLKECSQYEFLTDDYFRCAFKYDTRPENHQAGSCKMGPASDPTAVVDPQLRVYGIKGLRVADASIMPRVVSGNTHAATMMIGERAADFIKKSHVPLLNISAVEGGAVELPCDITPSGPDSLHMVLWFKDDTDGRPLYTVDVRGKALNDADHMSDRRVFGTRAYFRTGPSSPAVLVVDDIKRHDAAIYRCRVDFGQGQTRNIRYNLSVIVPPEQPVILDRWSRILNGTAGPYEEGDDLTLTCRVTGGTPQPKISWLVNGKFRNEEYVKNAGDVIENKLAMRSLTRSDLDMNFTCQASNTNLVEPKKYSVTLDLNLKPLSVNIRRPGVRGNEGESLKAGQRYDLECETTGSRPPAIITWYKGKRSLKHIREERSENRTISRVEFVPGKDDDRKLVTCRAENPNVTGLYLETFWTIDVVYPPVVSLSLGSTLNPEDIKEGDDVYFECHIKTNPPRSRLTWMHNGDILTHNQSARIIQSNQSLVLQSVTRGSAGFYVCSATNALGETRSEPLPLRVKFAPMCREDRIMVVGASRGESLNISCKVEADPPVRNFRWKFNNSGETLEVSPRRFTIPSPGEPDGISVLKYTPATELDYGTLSCWASNEIGTQSRPCLFQIVAAGKPFPVRNCTLANQTYTSVEVKCVPGYDGGLPQKFVLEVYYGDLDFLPSIRPLYNVSATDEPVFALSGLEASVDAGVHVAIYAVNAKGRSQSVILGEVTFRDAEKRTGKDAGLVLSPLIGIIVGALVTLILIVLVIVVRARRERISKPRNDKPAELREMPTQQYPLQTPQQTVETDPDVIPNKFEGHLVEVSPPSYTGGYPSGHWVTPGPTPSIDELCHKFTGRPTELRLPSRSTIPSLPNSGITGVVVGAGQLVVAGECLDGEAIKRRLMANRLPESCV